MAREGLMSDVGYHGFDIDTDDMNEEEKDAYMERMEQEQMN